MSPTNAIAWARLIFMGAVAAWAVVQMWTSDGGGTTIAATAIAVGMGIDKLFGLLESKNTADTKDVEKLEEKVDRL